MAWTVALAARSLAAVAVTLVTPTARTLAATVAFTRTAVKVLCGNGCAGSHG